MRLIAAQSEIASHESTFRGIPASKTRQESQQLHTKKRSLFRHMRLCQEDQNAKSIMGLVVIHEPTAWAKTFAANSLNNLALSPCGSLQYD